MKGYYQTMEKQEPHAEIKKRYLEEGIPYHGFVVGDEVEAKRNVLRHILRERGDPKEFIQAGTRLSIADIAVVHRGHRAGFDFYV